MMASSLSATDIRIESGPVEKDVLWMQSYHISEHIWNTGESRRLRIRRAVPMYQGQYMFPEAISDYLHEAGFYWVCRLGYMKIDAALISAFIERWRPETHTFHMPFGECTITLEDVSVLVGIPVDGRPLLGPTTGDWMTLCEQLLGVRPGQDDMRGSFLKLTWLADNFSDITPFIGDDAAMRRFTRAWILRFIGGLLLVDKQSSRVPLRYLQFLADLAETRQYSWGSALLSFLYREMCTATSHEVASIGGMVVLIQLWAWERFTCLVPPVLTTRDQGVPFGHRWLSVQGRLSFDDDVLDIRRKLDLLKSHEFVWLPYAGGVLSLLPPICIVGHEIWRCVIPLFCFQIVEWHQPDRVMRQFGMRQFVPSDPLQPRSLHQLTLRGKEDTNWVNLLQPMLVHWENRAQLQVQGEDMSMPMSYNDEYLVWYRKKSKLYIDKKNAVDSGFGDMIDMCMYLSTPDGYQHMSPEVIYDLGNRMAVLTCQTDRVTQPVTSAPPRHDVLFVEDPNILPQSRETRGMTSRRASCVAHPYQLPSMPDRGHGLYYTPEYFTQPPTQMPPVYTYPPRAGSSSDAAHSDSGSQSFGTIYGSLFGNSPAPGEVADLTTDATPTGPPWIIPDDITAMDDLLGVDLQPQFDDVGSSRQRRRRNPVRDARTRGRPCGTGGRHDR